MNPKVCVVIPTYNEAENLPDIVTKLISLELPSLQIIIVDDASPDGTGDIADSIAEAHRDQIQVLHRPKKRGIGPAYVAGFLAALRINPDIIVQMDADLSHPPDAIPSMLNEFGCADVVIGSRYVVGGVIDAAWGWRRRVLSGCGNAYARAVAGVLVRDASSGFKAFRREIIESLPLESLQCRGFGFQVEVAMACQSMDLNVAEIPIDFTDRQKGVSKISWSIVLEALWRLPMVRIRTLMKPTNGFHSQHRERSKFSNRQ